MKKLKRMLLAVAMLCVVMEKVEKGELSYYQKFSLTQDDVNAGTGFVRNYQIGKQLTLKELLHLMITASDNTATAVKPFDWRSMRSA